MSLILKAFPMAFLINPEANSKLSNDKFELSVEGDSLNLVKVATNLKLEEINFLMENVHIPPYTYTKGCFIFENGIKLKWDMYNGYYCAFLYNNNPKYLIAKNINPGAYLVKKGEELLKTFEVMLKKNIRNVYSKEIFYYCYKTPYRLKEDILDLLRKNRIENILRNDELEVRFRFNNKNYKYMRKNKRDYFLLESEQKISLLNIVSGQRQTTSRTLKTNYTDRASLVKTLREYGAVRVDSDEYNVTCDMFGMKLYYSKNFQGGSYNLEISRITDEDKCTKMLEDLDDEYKSNIQELTYKQIMERIKNQNLSVESEQICDDNSIVLTINVG